MQNFSNNSTSESRAGSGKGQFFAFVSLWSNGGSAPIPDRSRDRDPTVEVELLPGHPASKLFLLIIFTLTASRF